MTTTATVQAGSPSAIRLRVFVRGAVQGVGFRPFVYRLARSLGLTGWVVNTAQGVTVEAEGEEEALESFLLRLETESPPRACIHGLEPTFLDACGYGEFGIRTSQTDGATRALVLPDIAICSDCRAEVDDAANRRYRYPFTNCTNCGPRFSIIRSLPYDRPHTSMAAFDMCAHCRAEYDNPLDRRFHAQPNACADCGPQLAWWARDGEALSSDEDALAAAITTLSEGAIVAVKGLGGFHLMVDAANDTAIAALRQRKHREAKPLALMVPDIEAARALCEISQLESRLLQAPEAPITILRRRAGVPADGIAPGNPYLGIMLPYTPLHHLLLAGVGRPVVATSGNLSDEPICIDEHEAVRRLADVADFLLVHDRPIVRHVDDSIARVVCGREQIMRRARGYAPLPIHISHDDGEDGGAVLGVGAHLKNAVSLSAPSGILIGQHIGDLETEPAYTAFENSVADLTALHDLQPRVAVCDLHPDYLSTQYAHATGLPVIEVQHHHAHVLSCMADNELQPPVLGVCWDGTGLGTDDTVWGGEFLTVHEDVSTFTRRAHLRRFPLPGGDRAVVEPRRAALGALFAVHGERLFTEDTPRRLGFGDQELRVLAGMLRGGVNSPLTSSAGRLFDAVAALVGLRQRVRFEGQAAMELEFAVTHGVDEQYGFDIDEARDDAAAIDWGSVLKAITAEMDDGLDVGIIAAKFHNTMAAIITEVACRVGQEWVLLTGGCFQNRCLSERAILRLRAAGLRPYLHQRVPPNDGGIALGQVVAAMGRSNRVSGRSR